MVNRSSEDESESPGSDILETTAVVGDTAEPSGDTTISLVSQTPVVLSPGATVLEKFKIIGLLGQGGMGSVYRVEHLLMNRQFALKCLNKFQTADAGWKRFQNEAKAAHLLDHANLLKVFEVGLLPGGQPFFLMELIEGVTLADEIKRLGHLPVERAIKIFIQVAFAIGYAHDSRVIHRDLKPSNIMLVAKKNESDSEVVKVVDFGIAKLTGVDEFNQQTLTKTGEIFGSPLYMSPEQCMGVGVDHRSDLYSLGCVFYETLTSAPPFMGESALSTMMKHQSESQLPLKEASLGMQFPHELENIITRLLQKDPQHRYQSAGQLVADLILVEQGLKIPEDQAQTVTKEDGAAKLLRKELESPKYPISPALKKRRLIELSVVAAAFCLLGVVGCLVFLQLSTHSEYDKHIVSEKALDDQSDPAYEATVARMKEWSEVKRGSRDFFFPQTSIGKIVLANGEVYEAKGKVSVPSHFALGLIANENLVKHPEFLDKFKPGEIAVLDLDASRVAGQAFFAKIASMTGLRALNFYDTPLYARDLKLFSHMRGLLYLNVAFSAITGDDVLQSAPLNDLNCLDLTYVTDAKKMIPKLSQLRRLRQVLLIAIKMRDEDLIEVGKAHQLKNLNISWNSIKDEGVAHLTGLKKLEVLDLSQTHVTPEVWKSLAQMPNLRKVKLTKYQKDLFSPDGKRYFLAQMAKHAPQVQFDWTYEDNLEYVAGTTDLAWSGLGMQPHKSPILGMALDVEKHIAPVDSTHSVPLN